jgi:hypothetical protein
MAKQQYQDNFQATRTAIAKRILSSPLAAFYGYPDDEHRFDNLLAIASSQGDGGGGWSFISLSDFRGAGTNVSLDIRSESDQFRFIDEDRTDADGNEYRMYNLSFSVNWPCHGSTSVAVSLARIELYRQVALLAASLEGEFGGRQVCKMTRTAAEAAEAKWDAEAEKAQAAAIALMLPNKANMRVGAQKQVGNSDMVVPVGTYTHEFNDGKKFQLQVHEPITLGLGTLDRIA